MLKIILADNQAIFRTGAAKVLAVEDDVRIVAQAENEEKMNMEDSRHFLTVGVHGVIYRNVSGEALVQCIRKVSKGETWVQDTQESKETAENDLVGARVRDRLTAKELKIVALIVQGYKNKEIATQLGTTEQVIKNYLRNVYDKIGVSDRLELALFTIHHRILAEAAATSVAATNPR